MISPSGLRALELVLARYPNAFDCLARETLEALLDLGRSMVRVDEIVERAAQFEEAIIPAARMAGCDTAGLE